MTNLDLFVYDTQTKERTKIVEAPGYDGGPFFSPDGNRICYRSDRAGNDLLQVYVADLVFGEGGRITGIANERAVTANEYVNWGPFWHPSGQFLVYATSEVSHSNYEVFAVEVPAPAPGSGTVKGPGELAKRRITHADGFDGLPVFSADGAWMIWTSQRGGMIEGEQRPSSQVWAARVVDVTPAPAAP
jgi:Tol biopolymer transport system component